MLSHGEYDHLISHCPHHTAQIVKMAYFTAMRQSEILKLKWDRIELKSDIVRLEPEDTKTDEQRTVHLHPELVLMLKSMPHTIHGRVFTLDGKPVTEIKRSFKTACRKAGIKDLRFHDLRHTCINNWRLEGHDFFRIMKASGHKTMEAFKRYNTVTDEEVKALVPSEEDTYIDTTRENDSCELVTTV